MRPSEPDLSRLDEQQRTRQRLMSETPELTKIVERRRASDTVGARSDQPERFLKECIQVELWVESDGTESVVVNGSHTAKPLALKGLLHDGIYALAHADEPGYAVYD